jgi:hypothetical protein
MKRSGKSRGHNAPRKQSVRLPALILKHSELSRTKAKGKTTKSRIGG